MLGGIAQPLVKAALGQAENVVSSAYVVRVPGGRGQLVCFGTREQILDLLKSNKTPTPRKKKRSA
jgi:hypothetical protein